MATLVALAILCVLPILITTESFDWRPTVIETKLIDELMPVKTAVRGFRDVKGSYPSTVDDLIAGGFLDQKRLSNLEGCRFAGAGRAEESEPLVTCSTSFTQRRLLGARRVIAEVSVLRNGDFETSLRP